MPTNPINILVVGGAGYIGSHMVLALRAAGYHPVVLDTLERGDRTAIIDAELIVGDAGDEALLDALFRRYSFAAVAHFASYIEISESVANPLQYYQNNVAATLTLLQVMLRHGVNKLVFSSSAAVYGEPLYTPIDEQHPLHPMNPYGHSKAMVEQALRDLSISSPLRYVSLRYFNAAGADPLGRVSEHHDPESHLIPLVLSVAAGERQSIAIFGDDYATADGTCVRDYIHVSDICHAHLLALQYLLNEGESKVYNLGSGRGYSVREVIAIASAVTEVTIPVVLAKRRTGDPAVLVANPALAMRELAWQLRYPRLETIIEHAWKKTEISGKLLVKS